MAGAPLSGVGSVCRVSMTVLVAVSMAVTVSSVSATRSRVPSEPIRRSWPALAVIVAGDGSVARVDDRDGAVEIGHIGLAAAQGEAGR